MAVSPKSSHPGRSARRRHLLSPPAGYFDHAKPVECTANITSRSIPTLSQRRIFRDNGYMKILIHKSLLLAMFAPLVALTPSSSLLAQTTDRPTALPACATSGASSVFINGQSALRLSDVTGCPQGMFETVPGVFVEGQPAVRFVAPRGACAGGGSADVLVGGAPAGRAGDAACPPQTAK